MGKENHFNISFYKTHIHPGSLALLLADINPVAGVVLLHLHSLHLLLDGFHGEVGIGGGQEELQGVGGRLRSPCSNGGQGSISDIFNKGMMGG